MKRIFFSLFLLTVIWCLFLGSKLFLEKKPIENLFHIPNEANFAMRIDGTSVLKSTLFSVILEANDKELLVAINDQIKKQRKYSGPKKSLGIDYLSDILIYSMPFKKGQIIGSTFMLDQPDLMRKNASNAFDENQFFCVNNNIGVVLRYQGEDKLSPAERARIVEIANQIAFQPAKNSLIANISNKKSDKFVQLSSSGYLFGKSTLFTQTNLELLLDNNNLQIDGQLHLNKGQKEIFTLPKYALLPNGLHFSTTLIPELVQDSLFNLFQSLNFNLPKIESVSFNYRGVDVKNTRQGLKISPNLDLLMTFSSKVNFIDAISKSDFLENYGWEINNDHLTNGQKNYKVKQVNDHTVLISINAKLKAELNTSTHLLYLKGGLSSLTTVSGDPMIVGVISMLTSYKTSRDLFNKTEKFEISVDSDGSHTAKVKGVLQLKNGYYPMNEALKFGIANNFIRVN